MGKVFDKSWLGKHLESFLKLTVNSTNIHLYLLWTRNLSDPLWSEISVPDSWGHFSSPLQQPGLCPLALEVYPETALPQPLQALFNLKSES